MTEGEGPEEEAAPAPAAPPELDDLFAQAQHQLEDAAEEAAEAIVTGRAGGGAVEIRLNGNLEALSVHIDADVMGSGDAQMLEDLVLAALRQALSEAADVRERLASSLMPAGIDLDAMIGSLFGSGGKGPVIPGIGELPDLSSLMGGLFGAAPPAADQSEEPGTGEDSERG